MPEEDFENSVICDLDDEDDIISVCENTYLWLDDLGWI